MEKNDNKHRTKPKIKIQKGKLRYLIHIPGGFGLEWIRNRIQRGQISHKKRENLPKSLDSDPDSPKSLDSDPDSPKSLDSDPDSPKNLDSLDSDPDSHKSLDSDSDSHKGLDSDPDSPKSLDSEPNSPKSLDSDPDSIIVGPKHRPIIKKTFK